MRIVSKAAKRLMNLWLENKQRDIMDFVSTRFCYTAKTPTFTAKRSVFTAIGLPTHCHSTSRA